MISFLEGEVLLKKESFIILKTNSGVGFNVFLSKKSIEEILPGDKISLYSFLDVGEKSLSLYGFFTIDELDLFSSVKKISGIGGKAALAISSFGSFDRLKDEIERNGVSAFKGISGLGEKRIKKIILELSGQIKENKKKDEVSKDEVFLALKGLGFSKEEIVGVLKYIPKEGNSQERLKKALKILGGQIIS